MGWGGGSFRCIGGCSRDSLGFWKLLDTTGQPRCPRSCPERVEDLSLGLLPTKTPGGLVIYFLVVSELGEPRAELPTCQVLLYADVFSARPGLALLGPMESTAFLSDGLVSTFGGHTFYCS